jgi:hypothetical protein
MMTSNIRAVALDIDGTLAGADYMVSARAALTLEALQRKGVTPIIVTGRSETAAIAVSTRSRLTAPVVSCNGAVVTDPCSRVRLFMATLDEETVNRIMAFGVDQRLETVLWSAEEIFAAESTAMTALLEVINQEPVVIGPLDAVNRKNIVKIMLGGSRERLDALQDEVAAALPLVKRSLDVFYETSNPGATKWEALSLVLDRLGLAPEECMGIADGDTDVGWLTKIGMPVAVENARPAVHAIAAVRIGHHADDAVAQFLETYFELPGR